MGISQISMQYPKKLALHQGSKGRNPNELTQSAIPVSEHR
ncbi:hypothetical protein yrohd0001_11060 [Yersinia rohdei ATCC 43380]|nr:hypothetical protein yrohd0001_11060 [Yersinia rohdei ATCC 43380]